MSSRSRPQDGLQNLYLKPMLWGIAFSAAALALLLLLLSGLLTWRDVPVRFVDPMMIAAVSLAALAGAYLAARMTREKGMLVGLACSFALFVLLIVCGLPFTAGRFTTLLPVKLFSMLLCGAVGGILGVNRRARH